MIPSLPLAFLAGLLSFLSPCVFPLVPSYLAFVGGSVGGSVGGAGGGRGTASAAVVAGSRRVLLRQSLLFIAGFTLVFIAMGASASLLGAVLRQHRDVLAVAAGVVVALFGLVMLGVLKVPFLYRDARLRYRGETARPWGALLLGMAFAAGWSPCIGPILGGILTLAGASGTLAQGVALLAVYALGLAVPFLVAALALEPFLLFSKRFRAYLPWVERAAGALLLVAGLLMVTGTYTQLNTYLSQVTPRWLLSRL
jgi:cytochrome c-type biogenesis protein